MHGLKSQVAWDQMSALSCLPVLLWVTYKNLSVPQFFYLKKRAKNAHLKV